jgi:hypothetical protein
VGDTAEYRIGAEVTCSDGLCGDLSRVVLDPVARILTHLVVEPRHRPGLGRLVPLDLVDTTAEEIRLRCSMAEFDALEEAEEARFLSEAGEDMGYRAGEVFSWPYYGLGAGAGAIGMGGVAAEVTPRVILYDRVPAGEVEVRRGEHVHATDGDIGGFKGSSLTPEIST